MSIEAVDESLDGRFVQMSQVGCALTRFLTKHKRLWVDKSEGIDDYFALDRLNRINDYGDSSGGKLFEGLLGIDIDR